MDTDITLYGEYDRHEHKLSRVLYTSKEEAQEAVDRANEWHPQVYRARFEVGTAILKAPARVDA